MNFQEYCQMLGKRRFPIDFPGHWLGGSWCPTAKAPATKESVNPNRNEKILDIHLDRSTVKDAVDFAAKAFDERNPTPFEERIEVLRKFRQVLVDYEAEAMTAMQIEAGKPKWEAQMDFEGALRYLDRIVAARTEIEPAILGPVAVCQDTKDFRLLPIGITLAWLPFSTPCSSFVQHLVAAVLSNSPFVMISSGHAVLSGLLYAYACEMAELPKGVLNLVFGNFQAFRQALQDRRVRAVIYNGSREHCEMIRKESKGIIGRQLMLQSGGKNAVIVHSSADIERAVACTVFGLVKSTSQLCTSTSRVFVAKECMAEFKDRITAAIKGLKIGATDEEGQYPDMGPLYSQKSVDKFLRFQTMAKREARETLLWGKALDTDCKGFFVSPGVHVMETFDNTRAYQSNVLMSPDLAIYEFSDLDHAIEQVNTTDAPLVVSFMGDEAVLMPHRHRFIAPNLFNNLPTVDLDVIIPVAGRLQCGDHRMTGVGLVHYLTYPQAYRSAPADDKSILTWRPSEN